MQINIKNFSTENKSRISLYDWLRLIATFYVVIGHSAYLKIKTTYGGVSYILPNNLSPAYNSCILVFFRNFRTWVYTFHMPLFFILSGAVLALNGIGNFDEFVRKKIKRLIIPYFVFGWCWMLPIKFIAGFYNSKSILEAYKGFLQFVDCGHLWFLPALFWCMIAFGIIYKLLYKYNNSIYIYNNIWYNTTFVQIFAF